jgi:hypothetical protein
MVPVSKKCPDWMNNVVEAENQQLKRWIVKVMTSKKNTICSSRSYYKKN